MKKMLLLGLFVCTLFGYAQAQVRQDASADPSSGDVPLAVESSTAAHDDYAMRFSSDDVTSPSF